MARRLLVSYLTITALALAVVVIPLGVVFATREHDRLVFEMERDAQTVASVVEDTLEAGHRPLIDSVLKAYAAAGGRIVVVDVRGWSVADSADPAGSPRDFSSRPEIGAALAGRRVSGTRASETLHGRLLYVAVPVSSSGVIHGAVRVSYPTATVDRRVRSTWLALAVLAGLVLALVAAVGVLLARQVTRPVRRLEVASHDLAGGDLTARVPAGEGPGELQALAGAFNTMADRLAELVDSQRRFVADASHQLRTPLTALRLRLEMLAHVVPDDAAPALDAAIAETARLGRLVQSLLVLARNDASMPVVAPVDLARTVDERIDAWRPVAAETGVRLEVTGERDALVDAVPGAIEQVLDNLISNALDVAPEGSAITVQTTRTGDGWLELHVLDRGPGMDAEARARAFERFWRPAGAASDGFGLGLAIVHQLVQASGGEIRLDPGPEGAGLDVVVRLRAASATSDPASARRQEVLT